VRIGEGLRTGMLTLMGGVYSGVHKTTAAVVQAGRQTFEPLPIQV
jgi:hypothetical protein